MKQIEIILCLVFFLFQSPLNAQRQKKIVKIGVIDIQKIIHLVSSDRVMRTLLENNQTRYLKQAEELAKEIKKLKEIRDRESQSLPAQRLDAIQKDIIFKEEQLKKLLKEKSQILKQTESVLSQKLLREIYKFIKETAIKEGFSLILEKSTAVVYVEKELDITEAVLEALKKEKEKISPP